MKSYKQIFEIECILDNRQVTYYYSTDIEPCLTPNHLLYERTLTLWNTNMNDINYSTISVINQYYESQLLNNIFNHFWNRWQKECNLRETHKPNKLPTTLPIIKVNDTVDKLPSSQWKLGLVTKLIPGRDTKVRGTKVRFSRTTTIITKSINKPYVRFGRFDHRQYQRNP